MTPRKRLMTELSIVAVSACLLLLGHVGVIPIPENVMIAGKYVVLVYAVAEIGRGRKDYSVWDVGLTYMGLFLFILGATYAYDALI